MKLRCVDVRESLVRGRIVRQYSFVVLWPDSAQSDPPAEVRIVDTTDRGISSGWKIGSEIEVT